MGHTVREGGLEYTLEKMIEGTRARGRQREKKKMNGLTRLFGGQTTAAYPIQQTRNRDRWRPVIADVLKDMVPQRMNESPRYIFSVPKNTCKVTKP